MTAKRKIHWSITRIFFVAIGALIALFALYTFYNKNPLSREWNYEGRFTIVDPHNLTLLSYPSDGGSIIVMKIPNDVYISVVNGHGYYRVDDVLELGKSERKGDSLLIDSISELVGIPIEASKQRLSYWDQWRLWKMNNDNEVERTTIDLTDYLVTVTEKRVDNVEIEKLDPTKIDFYFSELFWERAIRDENITIGIFNASETPGLATLYSRLLENVGFRIVDISNWNGTPIDSVCKIRITGNPTIATSVSVSRLVSILDCPVAIEEEAGRFDIQIILAQ